MKRRMGRVLALLLMAGMLGTSPAMQVLAEEAVETQTETAVEVLTEDAEGVPSDGAVESDANVLTDVETGSAETDAAADSVETPESSDVVTGGTADNAVTPESNGVVSDDTVNDAETPESSDVVTDDTADNVETPEAGSEENANADEMEAEIEAITEKEETSEEDKKEEEPEEEKELVIAPTPDVNSFAVSGTLFDDVTEDSWYLPYVTYALNKGVMTGKGNNIFAPGEALARAQFAVVLWRISGSPAAGYQGTYPDVPDNQFYTTAVEWASSNEVGVITGYENTGKFGPGDNITREQMATMLYRFAKYKELDLTHTNDLAEFPDAGRVTEFALEAMQWAVGSGIIRGDKGNLNPQGNTNRAECATMLQRFCETFMPGTLQDIDLSAGCDSVSMTVDGGEAWLKVNNAWAARGIAGVEAKVWCYDDQSDAGFYTLSQQSDGSYGSSASVKYHGYHTGTYKMQAYILLDVGVKIPVGDMQTAEIEGTTGYYEVMSHVENIYNQVGRDLNACYWWCVNNISYRTLPIPLYPPEGYTGSEWYAMQAFNYGSGNCYVFAAVFYYCALGLGYDAEYIEGQVGMAAGGYGPHGWVIINMNGGSYICDPEAQYEIGGYNFYMQPVYSPVLQYRW